ncbi:MAG: polysaccharide deacetylase family protein [Alphaproteobacteria bacterium]
MRAPSANSIARKSPRAALIAACLLVAGAIAPALAAESAVVLMYHRFGEANHSSSNVTIETFKAHLAELRVGGYAVLPVPEIVAALRAGRPLPDRAVGITVDDAYLSVYERGWPLLREAGFPLTLFVAAGPIDEARRGYMNWGQVREMMKQGVTIGHHTIWHRRLQRATPARVVREIGEASLRYQAELGLVPEIFSYPYGEFSLAVRQAVIDAGFIAAFTQTSGVAHAGGDIHTLPRFILAEKYAGLERFRLAVNALPLPVRDLIPREPVLGDNPPPLGFTVDKSVVGLKRLDCYISGRGKARVEIIAPNRVEVRADQPFPPGRVRFNCTLRADAGRWRWLGAQYLIPK